MTTPQCLHCKSATVKGFLVDRDYTIPGQMRWVQGEPTTGWRSALTGEGGGDREQYRVATYRCAGCGALSSFATERVG
jgi:hypothetical protein